MTTAYEVRRQSARVVEIHKHNSGLPEVLFTLFSLLYNLISDMVSIMACSNGNGFLGFSWRIQ